ncbi:MAG: hypothetical protein ACKPKO_10085, partial [Candidatus Fonsibacter sp.]
ANSPFAIALNYNDIANAIAEMLALKGLDFWKMNEALQEAEDESRTPFKVYEVLGFLPGRESNIDREDPTKGLRRRVNALRLAVHPDKMTALARHLDPITTQLVFRCCTETVQTNNALYSIAVMQFERVKRILDDNQRKIGNFGRWQESDTAFAWWLLGNLHLDFIVVATSDVRWYIGDTFPPGLKANPRLNEIMAFPAELAREWKQSFHRVDQTLQLEVLLYKAYAYSKNIPLDLPVLDDLRCLNGWRIYIGLLNKINGYKWKS